MRVSKGWVIFALWTATLSQAFAAEPGAVSTGAARQRHRHTSAREAFFIGVCAGQALATQGLSVPMPGKGQPLSLDSPTEAALKEAFASCRAQANGGSTSPTADGTTTPNTDPTTTGDTTTATPSPSPSASPTDVTTTTAN